MSDLIGRQAAIDAIFELYEYQRDIDQTEAADLVRQGICLAEKRIEKLPSAQPEIIRCKDCRWGREVCGNIECFVDSNMPPEYHGYEWFCPNGERRRR